MLYDSLEIVFRSLWTWVSMEPGRMRQDWPEWSLVERMVLQAAQVRSLVDTAYCPACAADIQARRAFPAEACALCPVSWDGVRSSRERRAQCGYRGSSFALWDDINYLTASDEFTDHAENIMQRHGQVLAYKIANLKWKEK